MSIGVFYEGPAGSGKTFQLIDRLRRHVEEQPLSAGQRVLAVSFMHGARRRLQSRLARLDPLRGRFEAATIDHLAWQLLHRWRTLAASIGFDPPRAEDFNGTCESAAGLLCRPEVGAWMSASFPLVLLDEAQDLSDPRLHMLQQLSIASTVLTAGDEYQRLEGGGAPVAIDWLNSQGVTETLSGCRRTAREGLLEAAAMLRAGEDLPVPWKRPGINVCVAPGAKAPWQVAFEMSNHPRSRTIALLAPTKGGFAENVVETVRSRSVGRKPVGPFPIQWEADDEHQLDSLMRALDISHEDTSTLVRLKLESFRSDPVVREALGRLKRRESLRGTDDCWNASECQSTLREILSMSHRYAVGREAPLAAMTIHRAKNREFDGVIVLWPYGAGGSADSQRRRLYNAITRARYWCSVVLQGPKLVEPPFRKC